MNRFSEDQKRRKSPAESFLIGQFDLLPYKNIGLYSVQSDVLSKSDLRQKIP